MVISVGRAMTLSSVVREREYRVEKFYLDLLGNRNWLCIRFDFMCSNILRLYEIQTVPQFFVLAFFFLHVLSTKQ